MSVEDNKNLIKQAVDHFNAGDLEGYLHLYTHDGDFHFLPPGLPGGKEGLRIFYTTFRDGFPDMRFKLREMIGEGDYVAIRYLLNGTHKGEFLGVAPTGIAVLIGGITIMRFESDKCIECWSESDIPSLMAQIEGQPPINMGG